MYVDVLDAGVINVCEDMIFSTWSVTLEPIGQYVEGSREKDIVRLK